MLHVIPVYGLSAIYKFVRMIELSVNLQNRILVYLDKMRLNIE